jgi:hypothetical protein
VSSFIDFISKQELSGVVLSFVIALFANIDFRNLPSFYLSDLTAFPK